MNRLTLSAGFALLASTGLLAACSSADSNAGATPAAATSTTSAASTAPSTSSAEGGTATTAPAASASVQIKVSANTASAAEIQAALVAVGVTNADRWTREVMEYRPYPTNDPTFAKLRQELAKYNPGPGVADKIISVLVP